MKISPILNIQHWLNERRQSINIYVREYCVLDLFRLATPAFGRICRAPKPGRMQ
jgi:hypothetical protein